MKKKETLTYLMNNKEYHVIINRKKIKNTYIKIDDACNIIVNTNALVSTFKIKRLIKQYEEKIVARIEKKQHKTLPDDKIYYLGTIITVEFKMQNRFSYQLSAERLIINSNKDRIEAIDLFYKKEAQRLFNERLKICYQEFIKQFNIPFPELTIRKMKARYGTCYYHKNKIVLNVFLIKSTIEQIDFVIFHELTHFIHHNHSKSFYNTLGHFVPMHQVLRKDLNKL